MDKVLVLMSTFNGEKYITTQMDSILNQKGVDVFLLVRDDGSSDNTFRILHDYARKYDNITILEEQNCGAIFSFYRLMEYAVKYYSDYKYFAFSDQDDYWYPNKLERAISMNANNSDNFFYHSCYQIVDKELNILSESTTKNTKGTLGEALIANHAIGCSEVFTWEVLKNSAKICDYELKNKKYYPYHDLWVYLVALATKADICFDDVCGLKYRQHGHNVIGTGKSRIDTMKLQFNNLKDAKRLKSGFARILLDILDVDDNVHKLLMQVCNYNKSFYNKVLLVKNNEFRLKESTRRYAFIYSVLAGWF